MEQVSSENQLQPAFKNNEFYSGFNHFIKWFFINGPKLFWQMINAVLIRTYDSFSIEYLFKTLFAPWKRDVLSGTNINFQQKIQMSLWNLVSRIVGFFVRFITIVIGILFVSILSMVLMFLYCFWFLIPLAIVVLLVLIVF
jgi:hypothetical protein